MERSLNVMINNRQAMSLDADREVRRTACMSVARETTGEHAVDDPVPQELAVGCVCEKYTGPGGL